MLRRYDCTVAFSPILHAKSESYFWKGSGALSIKTFSNGRSLYQTGRGYHAVEEGEYLLLNRGQEYSIAIEANRPVESFCIFFPDEMAEEIYRSLRSSSSRLLDDPFSIEQTQVSFVEKTYRNDLMITPVLQHIKQIYPAKQHTDMWLEEQLHALMQSMLLLHQDVIREIARLPMMRSSTREEVYKRVSVGHDYIAAYFDQPLTIDKIAQVACMSPNHFLRSYKEIFGLSPHQAVMEKRLQQAKSLLLLTDKTVTDICLEVGFHSLGSFSTLFSRRFSESPARFRLKGDFREAEGNRNR
jgi:AraC family transcriptional regulator